MTIPNHTIDFEKLVLATQKAAYVTNSEIITRNIDTKDVIENTSFEKVLNIILNSNDKRYYFSFEDERETYGSYAIFWKVLVCANTKKNKIYQRNKITMRLHESDFITVLTEFGVMKWFELYKNQQQMS